MAGELVVGDLGQVLVQLLDHDLGRRLAQRVLELGDDARRRNKHELVEFPILELGGERVRNGADEVLLGGLVQIAARLDRERAGDALSLTRAGRSRPSSCALLCSSVETKLDSVRKAPSSSRSTKPRAPAIGDDVPKLGLLHDW